MIESIADHVRKPLIRMDMSALGSDPDEVECSLATTFELARKWDAISLLDEADIFLEQRKDSNLERNYMVGGIIYCSRHFAKDELTNYSFPAQSRIFRRHHVSDDKSSSIIRSSLQIPHPPGNLLPQARCEQQERNLGAVPRATGDRNRAGSFRR